MSARTPGQPYARWHVKDGPYLRRLRLRLEASLGAACAYCGLTREDGVELEFHHPLGRNWTSKQGHPITARRVSWCQRLHRYSHEIKAMLSARPACLLDAAAEVSVALPPLICLACAGERSSHCHKLAKRGLAPHEAAKLYDYPDANQPF